MESHMNRFRIKLSNKQSAKDGDASRPSFKDITSPTTVTAPVAVAAPES